jgi:hypothetical protein
LRNYRPAVLCHRVYAGHSRKHPDDTYTCTDTDTYSNPIPDADSESYANADSHSNTDSGSACARFGNSPFIARGARDRRESQV